MTYISNSNMEKQNYNIEDIIIRHLLKEASEEEETLLLSWLKSDVNNQKEFFRMKEMWHASQLQDTPAATNKSWNELYKKLAIVPVEKPVKTRRIGSVLLKYAATLLLLATAGFFAYKYGPGFFKKEVPVTYTEIVTPDGQKKEVILPDGTSIWINSGSTIRYASDYGDQKREVFLQGEAFFSVTRDTARTFIVHAENITIKVLGTSFNVKCYPDLKTIETTVISGTVSMENSEAEEGTVKEVVILNKKEKATFLRNQQKMYITRTKSKEEDKGTMAPIELRKISLNDEEANYIASWKDQVLSFNNESFEEMAMKLQRWFNVKITIRDEKLKSYRYKGKFDHVKSIFQVLEVVRLTTPITYEYDDKTKEITIKEIKH